MLPSLCYLHGCDLISSLLQSHEAAGMICPTLNKRSLGFTKVSDMPKVIVNKVTMSCLNQLQKGVWEPRPVHLEVFIEREEYRERRGTLAFCWWPLGVEKKARS